ncbi:MAG: c-type cytochrome [Candidatus Binatia bacterium]
MKSFRQLAATSLATITLFGASAGLAETNPTGERVFNRECSVCHHSKGNGDGPLAELLDPRPRNFIDGLYKLRSTPSGELPTDADLIKTVTNGMPGTGMPSFRHLGAETIKKVVAHLKTLGGPEGEEGSWFDLYEIPPPITVPAPPAVGAEDKARGAKLYVDMGCDGCHGKTGRGDGKPPQELIDNWGRPLHPRSFHMGVFKGGSRPEDLYTRIMTGLDGTPMTAFWKDVLSPDERWILVRYVTSFGRPRRVEQPSSGTIEVSRGVGPASVDSGAWEGVEATRVLRMPLSGGWIRYFEPLELRAMVAQGSLALRLSWDDGDAGCQALRVVFPADARSEATFGLGSEDARVRVWQWREGEQPAVFDSSGPGSEVAVDAKIAVYSGKDGSRRKLVMSGEVPAGASRLLLMVSGCSGGEDYLTASTFYDLEPPAPLSAEEDEK